MPYDTVVSHGNTDYNVERFTGPWSNIYHWWDYGESKHVDSSDSSAPGWIFDSVEYLCKELSGYGDLEACWGEPTGIFEMNNFLTDVDTGEQY